MIKLYITARDTDGDKAVTIFEDYELGFKNIDELYMDKTISDKLCAKIEEVEAINNQVTSPF